MVPFLDLKAQYRSIKDEIHEAMQRVLESTRFVLGPEVEAFENEFAAHCSSAHGVAVNSGTSALHLALEAADIGPGDEVITVANTFVASVAAISYSGATPVLVDVDESTYTLDPSLLEDAITARTKAIMPVHLYGHPADMDPILQVARKYGLIVIEDAAQAHGAEYQGRRCGGLGTMGCFSFYPSKNLGAYGEGGIVVTDREDLAARLRMLRDWGQEKKYHHVIKGFNARMDALQGAILRVKLRHLEDWTEDRIRSAALYHEELRDCVSLRLPPTFDGNRHVFHLYVVRLGDRAAFQAFLQDRGIGTGIHYPVPIHLTKAYQNLAYQRGDFPVTERLANEIVSLPMFPELTSDDVTTVTDIIKAWAEQS